MKRLAKFLRSVIPADPAQLLFLAGAVCLVIAPRVSWWPAGAAVTPEHGVGGLNEAAAQSIGTALRFPILFAGIAGYFICFWPGKRPVRRIFGCIYVPTVLALAAMCWRILYFATPYRSILEATMPNKSVWSEFLLWKVPGIQFCLIGLLLMGISTSKLIRGVGSLPLALPGESVLRHEDPEARRRMQILIWVLVGPLFLTMAFFIVPMMFSSRLALYVRSVWFVRLGYLADALVLLGIALCVIGRSAGQVLKDTLRLPGEKYALLAAAFSAGIPALIATGQYLFERAQWVRHDVATAVSEPGAYFNFSDGWLFLLFFPALVEEIIFRGWLQPRFVRAYGLYRGIFLVGIVWAAFHFPFDLSFSHFGSWAAIQSVCFRLFTCIALSFVLGWLTLESGSVLAAALAHTFYNVLAYSDLAPPFPGKDLLRVGLWAALGWILFHYWPMETELPEAFRVAESG
jgi:membrane protease YdiL (CAAX protease family)